MASPLSSFRVLSSSPGRSGDAPCGHPRPDPHTKAFTVPRPPGGICARHIRPPSPGLLRAEMIPRGSLSAPSAPHLDSPLAPPHAQTSECLSHLPTRGSPPPSTLSTRGSQLSHPRRRAHPSCPRPPGSPSPLPATSVPPPPPHAPPRPGGSSPNNYRTRARESSPSTPASARSTSPFLPPHAAAVSPPLPCQPVGRGPAHPIPSSPPPQPVVLSSGPQSRPHPSSRKPSAPAPPTLSH